VKPFASPCRAPAPSKPGAVGRTYIMSKKEASKSGAMVTGTLFLNFKPFFALFGSDATHSFIFT